MLRTQHHGFVGTVVGVAVFSHLEMGVAAMDVELFLEEVEARLENLGMPGMSLEHDLHFLKGSALNLGFADFGALCAQGETAAAQGQSATINIEKIKSVYAASRALFLPNMNADMAS